MIVRLENPLLLEDSDKFEKLINSDSLLFHRPVSIYYTDDIIVDDYTEDHITYLKSLVVDPMFYCPKVLLSNTERTPPLDELFKISHFFLKTRSESKSNYRRLRNVYVEVLPVEIYGTVLAKIDSNLKLMAVYINLRSRTAQKDDSDEIFHYPELTFMVRQDFIPEEIVNACTPE